MPRKVEVSHKSIIFAVLFVLFLWFLYYIRDILVQLFLALMFAAILNPLVTKLSKYKIPRPVSILLTYVVVFGVVGFTIAGILPPLFEQTANFTAGIPVFIESSGIKTFLDGEILKELLSQLSTIPAQFARVALGLFGNFFTVITTLIFAFYFLLSFNKIESTLTQLFRGSSVNTTIEIIRRIEVRLGKWASGQILLMLIIGSLTYIGLVLLGFPFAAPIALLTGLLEIIPFLGPIIAAVPVVIIGFGISPYLGIAAIALVFLIQQLENYIIVPKVMGKSVGLSPIVVLIALAVGFRMAGFVGIIISIPLIIIFQEIINVYFEKK